MKIAILGSAPSSLGLAPFGDTSWKIWGCSPGVFPQCPRADAWFEVHRWEPPVIGVAAKQVPWFSPEYVTWMAMRDPRACPVWMADTVPQIPASRRLPWEDLVSKYGSCFFTSSIAWMIACAIDNILEARGVIKSAATEQTPFVSNSQDDEPDMIGLWGVDMAANEEYGYQRAGCQHFLLMAAELGIQIQVPPESDLLRPMPLYGICESSHWMVKNTQRRRELEGRLAGAQQQAQAFAAQAEFLKGALDDTNYHMLTWGEDREGTGPTPTIMIQSPRLRGLMAEQAQAQRAAEYVVAAPEQPAQPPLRIVPVAKKKARKKATPKRKR